MLIKRVITAIVLGLLVVIGICYLPIVGFSLAVSLVLLLAAWEFSGLFSWDLKKRIGFLALLVASGVSLCFFDMSYIKVLPSLFFFTWFAILIIGVIWWVISPFFLWRYTTSNKKYFNNFIPQLFLGMVTFIPCLVGLIAIRLLIGMEFIFLLLASVWATDIGAYFIGRRFGDNLLAPKISPKKTVEGLLGGLLFASLVAIIGVLLLKFTSMGSRGFKLDFDALRIVSLVVLMVVCCMWSVVGDLFESMLKRQSGIKDSGSLLPGHGGMYDRIDSLLVAAPIFALGLMVTI